MIRRTAAAGLGALTTATLLVTALLVAVPTTALAAPPGPATTASTTTAVRADGSRVLTTYSGPVRMRRGAGWMPMNLTLTARPDGTVRPVASPQDLVLTRTGPAVTYAGGGQAALNWTTALPAPRLAGSRATYPQARPGYDLVVEATVAGFVASLRRAGPAAPPPAPLTLRGTATHVAALPEGTSAAATEGVSDSAVSRVVAATPHAARTPFDTTVQTTVLRSDTSGEPDLRLGSYDGTAVARSYLTFDLPGLARARVTRAVLEVHQDWSASCRARPWEVWSAPAAGPASRWVGQPAAVRREATATDTRGHDASCAPGWSSVDVTALVRSWAASKITSGTVQLRATDETDPLSWKRFGSAESTTVPHLTVTLAAS